MCEKLAYLICFVFVLSLAGNAEAGLVAHYKLDETTGTIAADSSGNGFDGTITGSTSWAAGKIDGALQLSGDGVTLPASGMGMTSNSGSVAFWMNAGTPSGINTMFWAGDNTTGGGFGTENELHVHIESATANIWTGGELSFYIYNPTVHLHSDPTKGAAGNVPVNPILLSDEQWHHVAAAWGGGSMKLYIDGVLITQASYAPANFVMNNIFLGRMANNSRLFTGLLDDVQIYNHALSDAEVLAAMSGGAPLGFAGKPKPADKAQDVFSGTILSWKPGYYAAEGGTHNVFIGTDINDVNNATIEQPLNVITAEGLDVNNFDPGALEFGATYYWRVDEVNSPSKPGQYKGDIWQFTVEPSALKIPAENITVSSLGAGVGSDPNQTINESGLNPENMDLHSKVAGYMWISTGDVNDVWIRYDFDRVYKLDEMLVWNYNSQFLLKVGFKDVTVEYSEDGQTWKALADVPEFAQGTGKESYLYNTVVDFNGAAAQSVRLTANSNWSNGTITKVGLSEVRFMYIPVWAKEPYPANESINVPLDVTLSWRAGREAAEHKVYLSQDEQSVAD
ncbi:MAG: discoidin domain-containing protein, partial [Sedimentisphaerales bacterium]|nr:discoidin domain-containing protein [Sedimentisphaerales bacterium]